MALWRRMTNVFRGERLNRELDEEMEAHLEEALARGRDPAETRRPFGAPLRHREASRDAKIIGWLDSLRADAVFGLRQLRKAKITSIAAILSLGISIGACASAFRLLDAVLLRPLPIAQPQRLYEVSRDRLGWDGKPGNFDAWSYPSFQRMRAAVRDQAELIAISYAVPAEITYKSEVDMEKAYVQYVSGCMFRSLGLHAAEGRLLTETDDQEPLAHPYAVISYDYWTHRFGKDPNVVGRTFRKQDEIFQIIGVSEAEFTGTEPGVMVDIFLPTMMNPSATRAGNVWHRTLAMVNDGEAVEPIRQKLDAVSLAFETERAKTYTHLTKQMIANELKQRVTLEPAPSGVSELQQDNRRALAALGVLVGLVLLVACANVANLMTAQAAARSREMALRVSIGAGRGRLVQLVLMESAMVALLAGALGGLFAWWSAPFVVSMINPANNPARLVLPADWRVLGFGLALTAAVMLLFGLAPALNASAVQPISALKGGEDPRSRRRSMNALIAAQVAFCFLVLFVSALFSATFYRLSKQPTGFSAERLLALDVVSDPRQTPTTWEQVAEHLRTVPGVEKVALASWPLLSGGGWNDAISIPGAGTREELSDFLQVSPGWIETMKIPLLEGRDFRAADTYPGATLVNETFVKHFLGGGSALGKKFAVTEDRGRQLSFEVIGVVGDARYLKMKEEIPPVAYVPLKEVGVDGAEAATGGETILVKTKAENPLALVTTLRKEVAMARPGFRVRDIRTQEEINSRWSIRERLLAMLGAFFAGVALLLSGVGLYGVLHYAVLQRRREIGIRIAVGAQGGAIARLVTLEMFFMVIAGAIAGLVMGMASARLVESLFFQVKATDWTMIAIPSAVMLATAVIAATAPVLRAVSIDPVEMLRAE